MNNLIISLAFFLLPADDSECIENFYKVSFGDTSYQGAINIKINIKDSSGNLKPLLGEGRSMYYFFKGRGLNYEEYKKMIQQNYASHNGILVFKDFPENSGFLILREDRYVNRIARRGKEKLIAHFFKDSGFNPKYQNHFEGVLGTLFDFGVVVSWVEGSPRIAYKSDCNFFEKTKS
jgi:hypothetical protein